MVAYLYWRRLRSHAVQELLAGAGVAVGVALLVGALASSATLTRGGDELIRALVGHARFGLAARSLQEGFNERIAAEAGRLPGVKVAVDLLRDDVSIRGPRGLAAVQLWGVSSNLADLGGLKTSESEAEAGVLAGGLGLPRGVARSIGARVGDSATVVARGQTHSLSVQAVLSSGQAALADSRIAVALLPVAQRLAGRPGKVSGVLIQPQPGADRVVEAGLRRIAGGRLEVDTVPGKELELLAQATSPTRAYTTLFAEIGAMVGFLLAVSAMLLTAPERRRFAADLQVDGYDWRQILLVVGSQAIALGLLASVGGVVIGEVLSRTLFRQPSAYFAIAFPLSAREQVDPRLVVLALVMGVAATLLASVPVLLDLLPHRMAHATARRLGVEVIGARLTLALGAVGVVLIGTVTVVVLAVPSATVTGASALGVAALCLVGLAFAGCVRSLDWLSDRVSSSSLIVAVRELRGGSVRAVVVAGVVTLAVYSTVVATSAQRDLVGGIERGIAQYFDAANIWVTPPEEVLNINSFPDSGAAETVARLPAVASVRIEQGTLLDVGDRRMWVDAPPTADPTMIPSSQLVHGALRRANALLRRRGWAAVSAGFASEKHARIGGTLALPTPSGIVDFKVAAIITNLAWPPGALIINPSDFHRYWHTSDPSALKVDLKPGVAVVTGKHEVEAALRGRPGLSALTSAERIAANDTTDHQQLESVTVISTLLLTAAAVAVALALSAAIWQRRVRLASLKIQGYDPGQLWRALLLESAVVLGVGALVGAMVGIYAHVWASRWLRTASGFYAPFSLEGTALLIALALMVGVALAVVALPGVAAARVSPRLSFQE
jgi:putative ABC transport system permease protein